jgi:hypothetical protein
VEIFPIEDDIFYPARGRRAFKRRLMFRFFPMSSFLMRHHHGTSWNGPPVIFIRKSNLIYHINLLYEIRTMKKRRWVQVLFALLLGLGLSNIHVAIFDSSNTIPFPDRRTDTLMDLPRVFASTQNEKTIIAYAVTVTSYDPDDKPTRLLDRAAVLHQSIKLAMKQSARYDYHLYAFVHPDAQDFAPYLEQLGYRVQMHDTPFNITEVNVANPSFVRAQRVGCCGEKEYLKLYSWLLLDYPVVLHMDLDTLVLRPMDDLFDLMTDPSYDRRRFQNSSMWTDMEQFERPVDFLFTRDYNMVSNGRNY